MKQVNKNLLKIEAKKWVPSQILRPKERSGLWGQAMSGFRVCPLYCPAAGA